MFNCKRLFRFLATGTMPEMTVLDESLAEHDKKYHPEGYKDGDRCNKRENDAKLDKVDAEIDAVSKASKNSNGVTAVEDAAYIDAVKRGDMETAQRMVREAVARAMPNTKVIDEDGLPKVVYHCGTFGNETTTPSIQKEGMHFGTLKAAKARKETKIASELRAKQSVTTFRTEDGRWHYITGKFGPNEYNSSLNGSEGWDSEEEARKVGEESFEHEAENASEEDYGYRTTSCFLNITNVYDTRDQGPWWVSEVRYAKERGFNGLRYKNLFEDKGSISFVAFNPSQIKSSEPVTYDDDGNVIPLSRRFDNTNDDIRY